MAESTESGAPEEPNAAEQLLDLLVHAPIGLLYERDKVMETVVKRGRSQVQLARLMAGMARQQVDVESKLLEVAGAAGTVVAKGITDVGVKLGLAPEMADAAAERLDDAASAVEQAVDRVQPPAEPSDADEPAAEAAAALPIAGYDELKAKEIVGMLADLTPSQRDVIRAHEAANRGRKTVLGKLDQLDA